MLYFFSDNVNECDTASMNVCNFQNDNQKLVRCVDLPYAYMCRCDYQELGILWDNTAKKCLLPGGGKVMTLISFKVQTASVSAATIV